MTAIFVFFFGKYNESKDFESDRKDNNEALNKSLTRDIKIYNSIYNESALGNPIFNDFQLQEFKWNRNFEIKFGQIMNQLFIFTVFLFFLYAVSFSNISNSAIFNNHLFQNTFVIQQSPNEIGLNQVSF